MDPDAIRWHHQLRTRLTTIKLALQVVKRHPERCQAPDGLVDHALQALNSLVRELEEWETAQKRGSNSV